jgi:hypothetical protein
MFGEKWFSRQEVVSGAPSKKGDAKDAAAVEEDDYSYLTIPIIVLIGVVATVIAIVGTSGSEKPVASVPKAIVFIVQGLKGTTFHTAVTSGTAGPNMQNMATNMGAFAACEDIQDVRCARAQDGATLGGAYRWQAAPGVASILTGVGAKKHMVANNSFDQLLNFAKTSDSYPSVLARLKKRGFSTAVVGSSALVSTVGTAGMCTEYGVLDFECGGTAYQSCLAASTCNTNVRTPLTPAVTLSSTTGTVGSSDVYIIAQDVLAAMNANADFIMVNFNQYELAAQAVGGSYAVNNSKAMAQLYLIDAVIGEIVALISQRTKHSNENWLMMGVADHGGSGSSSGSTANEDEVIALFAATETPAGTLSLSSSRPPARQMDVAPTVLKWFGALDNVTAAAMDGSVQFICTDGYNVGNCSDSSTIVFDSAESVTGTN